MEKKISIFGAGSVGSTAALMAVKKEIADVILWNRTPGKAKGLALDIKEASPLEGYDADIKGTGNYSDTKDSDILIITAGAQRKEGMSRGELLNINAGIVKKITENAVKHSPNAIIIIVTNPLDAMAYLAKKTSKFPRNHIMGMAGVLDSSRFRSFISMELNVSVEDIQTLVLGGHGDSMVPLPRHSSVSGIPLTELLPKNKIKKLVERTRNAGAEIISLEKDSSAYYSPASSITQMVESILKDKKRIFPASAYLQGEYGVKGIFMGVPVVLGKKGIEKIIEIKLNSEEKSAFKKSVGAVKKLVSGL